MNGAKHSKSARKREHLALQALGEKLITLEPSELDKMPLDERLREAVSVARNMTSRGALRRQKQLIGKLMRDADAGPIASALESAGRRDRLDKAVFHEAEAWRDRIVAEGRSAAAEFTSMTGAAGTLFEKLLGDLDASSETDRRTAGRRIFRQVHAALQEARAHSTAEALRDGTRRKS